MTRRRETWGVFFAPCPVCAARSVYVPELDRYMHEDGTADRGPDRGADPALTEPWRGGRATPPDHRMRRPDPMTRAAVHSPDASPVSEALADRTLTRDNTSHRGLGIPCPTKGNQP